jgi:allophanate hydrolase
VRLAVVGAHLSGMPLNWQLTRALRPLVAETRTAAQYRLFALPGSRAAQARPAARAAAARAIEVEVWELPATHFGSFVAGDAAPLGIGSLQLQTASEVQGFLCEATARSTRTRHHRFRWLARLSPRPPLRHPSRSQARSLS